jgi:hypothetical protein
VNDSLPAPAGAPKRWSAWWVAAGALLVGAFYAPTLATRFDFIDDGNLVYPTAPMPLGERLGVVWHKIEANVEHLGPFRPVLWAHWELAADLFQGRELAWRGARLAWCMLAGAMLLWLLRELNVPLGPALFVAGLAMAAPFRNEVWTSLTLGEGVAMPYAFFALVAARKASASRRPWAWELGSALACLAALGCKNTFAALVPAMIALRLLPDGVPWREALRRHGRRALLLALPLAMPAAHFVYFKLNWHPGQYETKGPSVGYLFRYLHSVLGGIGIDFVGAGLAVALVLVLAARRAPELHGLLPRYRAALVAGLLLLAGGTALYLPMQAISGRYTMPAVWGVDLFLAVLLTGLARLPARPINRVAWGLLGVGLVAVAVAGIGKQVKFAARSRMLWQALEVVEREAPRGAHIHWYSGPSPTASLNIEEGIHFLWHLQARGRDDLGMALIGPDGQVARRVEVQNAAGPVELEIWGVDQEALTAGWQARPITVTFWGGRKRFECRVAQRPDKAAPARVSRGPSLRE